MGFSIYYFNSYFFFPFSYNEYMLLDPLGVVSGTRGETKIDDDNISIPEAPISIKVRNNNNNF